MTHQCPRVGCAEQVPSRRLMCRTDWYRVPYPLRQAVTLAYRGGAGAGSDEHQTAMADAIESVNPPTLDLDQRGDVQWVVSERGTQ